MKRIILITALTAVLSLSATSLLANSDETTNQPDSVYLFAYTSADGTGGLKFAWSNDRKTWESVGDGYAYLTSDFGSWETGKKIYNPRLARSTTDGQWHCTWEPTESGEVIAHAASPDLLTWGRQTYSSRDTATDPFANSLPSSPQQIIIGQKEEKGYVQKVEYALLQQLVDYAAQRQLLKEQYAVEMAQDSIRFAGLQPLQATITIHADASKPISNHLIGIFFEDINYAADGGLYAELVQNRDFEYSADDRSPANWSNTYAWTMKSGETTLPLVIATEEPIHPNNPHYAVLNIHQPDVSLENTGFDGIPLKKGETYDFSLFARVAEGSKGGKITVSLLNEQGQEVASAEVEVKSKAWEKLSTTLHVNTDVNAGSIALRPQKAGVYHLDMISLFPQQTFKNRKNGLRADLAETLAALHPRFMRFPGGCVAHGNGIDNIYDWKGSIGPLEARKPLTNIWGYHQTRGLGYYEFFQFCEDLGAEPVPVLAAGVPCQNSSRSSHYTHDELTLYGQQQGIPLADLDAYIQDILDLVEYANGDTTTTWGKKRAEAGHPQPFNLKYLGIGNEDMISDVFEQRFTMIYKAVREKYPQITVIGTVGPFYEGADYDEGWALATQLNVPVVDEHYYVSPGWMINNQDFYDKYSRTKPKVYLGEYAAHLPNRANNIETALAEALYLTAVERNADEVIMASYAPLLAKKDHTQWYPDLIYFDNTQVSPTTDYFVQQMYGQNAGNNYLPSTILLSDPNQEICKRVAASIVKDDSTGDYIARFVNTLPVKIDLHAIVEGLSLPPSIAFITLLTGQPAETDARPTMTSVDIRGDTFDYVLQPYSFTMVRVKK